MSYPGITVCAVCGEDLVATAQRGEKPVHELVRACQSCDFETEIRLCWYPDGAYDIVASDVDAVPDNCQDCSDEADLVVIDSESEIATGVCRACASSHHVATVDRSFAVASSSDGS